MKFWMNLLELIVVLLFIAAMWGGFLGTMLGLGFVGLWLRLYAISDKLEPSPTVVLNSTTSCDHLFWPVMGPGGEPEGQRCGICGKFNSLDDILAQAEATRDRGR